MLDLVIIPALVLAARDEARGVISEEDEGLIVAGARDIVEHLHRKVARAAADTPVRALGIAAHRPQGAAVAGDAGDRAGSRGWARWR